ncbi:NAD(P)-dependent oxidoreductase [Belnapia sp. T6]|uniref:NAD(P)-dependent oxidoreductase n=1 Tax=Belnapia mucosa TaxID=2804532 RepID=A0ABS1V7N2_9PROT|nr:NAD(P)-dependent oxidoreductase [Belnapia mucosa]MBL6457678.1 NAD(P)-dependent oxidoreductase [Belnapia mucosa]
MRDPVAPVGIAGLGLVGSALAARLLAAGHPVFGWDPKLDRRMALAAAGGEAAPGPAALIACPALFLAAYDAAQVESLLDALPGGGRLATLVLVTTCDPGEAQDLARQAMLRDLGFVEFPISGTSRQIREGKATGLLAGEEAAIDRVAPLLAAVCPHHIRVGRAGDAARMKLAVNLVLQINRIALAEGIVLAERLGLDPGLFLRVARDSAAYSAVMDSKGEKMVSSDFTPESRIAQTLKDAELILAAAAAARQVLPLAATGTALLRAAIASGGGERDSAAVIEAIRALGWKREAP